MLTMCPADECLHDNCAPHTPAQCCQAWPLLFVVPAGRLHTTELAQWVKRQKEWHRERKRRQKMAAKQATRTDPALLLQGIHSSRPQPRSQLTWADHDYLEDLQGKHLPFTHTDAPVTACARGLAAERLTATHMRSIHRSLPLGAVGACPLSCSQCADLVEAACMLGTDARCWLQMGARRTPSPLGSPQL